MTDYDLFGATAGPATSTPDGPNQYTLAVEFSLTGSAPLWLKGYRFWRPADLAITGPITARTWGAVTEAAVPGSDATFALAGSGWQQALLATPVPLTLATRYRAGCHFPNGQYSFTNGYWGGAGPGSAGIIVGPLVGHGQSGATAGEQGSLWSGPALAFPNNGSPGAANYWVTPIITDVDPAGGGDFRQGSVSIPVGLGFGADGEKGGLGTASVPADGVVLSEVGAKHGSGVVYLPVAVAASAVGSNSQYESAPVSEVLCSAWASPADIPDAIKDALPLNDSAYLDPLMRASEILWALSGRRWYGGGCTERVTLAPALGDEHHESWGVCGCWDLAPGAPYAHMDQPRSIRLPRVPAAIVSVVEDGVPLASTAYRLARSGWLERIDGGLWDVCSGTTVITYSFGEPPPRGGRAAAVTLGLELAKDANGISGCKLPKRTTSVTRQGVSIEMFDPQDFLDKGGVGIISVDLWLKSVNPGARTQPATVWSPELEVARRREML